MGFGVKINSETQQSAADFARSCGNLGGQNPKFLRLLIFVAPKMVVYSSIEFHLPWLQTSRILPSRHMQTLAVPPLAVR